MAERWQFPPVVQGAIRYHHKAQDYCGENPHVVQCVEIANVICSLKGITAIGRKLVRPSLETFDALGLQKEDIVVLATDLDGEISRNGCLFES